MAFYLDFVHAEALGTALHHKVVTQRRCFVDKNHRNKVPMRKYLSSITLALLTGLTLWLGCATAANIKSEINSASPRGKISPDARLVYTAGRGLRSVVLNRSMLRDLDRIEGVVLIGCSCAGKTTLAKELRRRVKGLSFPLRYVTRPRRANDDPDENEYISKEVFRKHVADGVIGMHWARHIEGVRESFSGFSTTIPVKGIPVYMANNDFFGIAYEKRQYLLIVAVHAPQSIRSVRLGKRSPEMNAKEREWRIAKDKILKSRAHIVIHNYGVHEQHAKENIVSFFDCLLRNKAELYP